MVSQIHNYRWPTTPWPLAGVGVRVDELAVRLGLTLEDWDEDGLGPARGALCQLKSGRVVLISEKMHAIEHLGARGPDLEVDATDVAQVGVQPLINELRQELSLEPHDIDWIQPRISQQNAREWLSHRGLGGGAGEPVAEADNAPEFDASV